MDIDIRPTTEADVPLILTFIRELADYERLSHEVVATEEALRDSLFGEPSFPEVLLGYGGGSRAAFALFFQPRSTHQRSSCPEQGGRIPQVGDLFLAHLG
jgi:hypothetical protein